jgi:hypothetical protein
MKKLRRFPDRSNTAPGRTFYTDAPQLPLVQEAARLLSLLLLCEKIGS